MKITGCAGWKNCSTVLLFDRSLEGRLGLLSKTLVFWEWGGGIGGNRVASGDS